MAKSNKSVAKDIRQGILSRRQLRTEHYKQHLTDKLPVDPTGSKTTLMLYVEGKFRQPIEVIIWSAGVRTVAKKLELQPRTISRWRKEYPNAAVSG